MKFYTNNPVEILNLLSLYYESESLSVVRATIELARLIRQVPRTSTNTNTNPVRDLILINNGVERVRRAVSCHSTNLNVLTNAVEFYSSLIIYNIESKERNDNSAEENALLEDVQTQVVETSILSYVATALSDDLNPDLLGAYCNLLVKLSFDAPLLPHVDNQNAIAHLFFGVATVAIKFIYDDELLYNLSTANISVCYDHHSNIEDAFKSGVVKAWSNLLSTRGTKLPDRLVISIMRSFCLCVRGTSGTNAGQRGLLVSGAVDTIVSLLNHYQTNVKVSYALLKALEITARGNETVKESLCCCAAGSDSGIFQIIALLKRIEKEDEKFTSIAYIGTILLSSILSESKEPQANEIGLPNESRIEKFLSANAHKAVLDLLAIYPTTPRVLEQVVRFMTLAASTEKGRLPCLRIGSVRHIRLIGNRCKDEGVSVISKFALEVLDKLAAEAVR